jgi:hypothetical protein
MKNLILKASKKTHMMAAALKAMISSYKQLIVLAIMFMGSGAAFAEVDATSAAAAGSTFCNFWNIIIPWKNHASAFLLLLFVFCYVPLIKDLLTAKVDSTFYFLSAIIVFSSKDILIFLDTKFDWAVFTACA